MSPRYCTRHPVYLDHPCARCEVESRILAAADDEADSLWLCDACGELPVSRQGSCCSDCEAMQVQWCPLERQSRWRQWRDRRPPWGPRG